MAIRAAICERFTPPGNTRGHLCFYEETPARIITGDLVVGIGTR